VEIRDIVSRHDKKHPGAKQMASPFYTAEHEAYRDVVRRFVEKEIEPYAHEWDEAGGFPRALYEKAAAIGLLGLGFPEEYGGTQVDNFMWIVAVQELAQAGAGGVSASLNSSSIGAPPIARAGPPELKARVLPQILSGKKISALAITEPSGGSDVANLRTSARRDGDVYVVNGEKTFITSGMRADYVTTAAWGRGQGFQAHHAQFQQRAADHGGRLHRGGAGLPRGGDGIRQTAVHFRQAVGAASGDPAQAGRHGAACRGVAGDA
jgi:alkylation response protein AidB-like acyl-CoA dehydrogenase